MLNAILNQQLDSDGCRTALPELFDMMDGYIYIKDNRGHYCYANKKGLDVYGVELKDIVGKNDQQLLAPELADKIISQDSEVLYSGRPQQQKVLMQMANRELCLLITSSPIIQNGVVRGIIGFGVDVSADMLERRTLLAEANTDGLTGCFNRRYLHMMLKKQQSLLAEMQIESAVVIIDIDRFKAINDHYGHAMGDKVLIELVNTINAHTRANDVLCRYGGDEFVLILPDSSLEQAKNLTRRLVGKIEALNFGCSRSGSFSVSCSFGIASFRNEQAAIIECADKALYQSKKGCSDKIHVYNPKTNLIEACTRNCDEFVI